MRIFKCNMKLEEAMMQRDFSGGFDCVLYAQER